MTTPRIVRAGRSRREFMGLAAAASAGGWCLGAQPAKQEASGPAASAPRAIGTGDGFPALETSLVREIVGASHRSLERVKDLLTRSPRLANAAWDWGFGDIETALGAASHTGQRDIAEVLLAHGARADIFCMAMLGRAEAVRAMIEARPGIQRIRGPHSLSLMHHARAGGESAAEVVAYLDEVGGADEPITDLPIDDAIRAACAGVFEFGPGGGEVFEIFPSPRRGNLMFRRGVGEAGSGIVLFRTGEREFHPAGAPETRIAFDAQSSPAESVRIWGSPGVIVCEGRRRPA